VKAESTVHQDKLFLIFISFRHRASVCKSEYKISCFFVSNASFLCRNILKLLGTIIFTLADQD